MHNVADFRSDTVTRPTPAMREALANAEVGDDVLGDDPTVAKLERRVADLFGMEAAVFVPSGTMGNSVLIATHARPGDEIIAEEWAHTLNFERGGLAGLWGILTRTLRSERGAMDPDEIAKWIRPGSDHTPRTAAVTLENTHNFHGGAVVPIENLRAIREICLSHDVPVHLDGARIWNAAAATGIALTDYADLCDTMTVCLSKGLGAPVGSVAMGSVETIRRARLFRKRLGGGMRQSGTLAAAGLVAIDTMRERLVDDHANARRLAEGMASIPGLGIDLDAVETNILFVRITGMSPDGLVARLSEQRILAFDTGPDMCRFVTHADVDAEDVERTIEILREIFTD